MWNFSVGSRHDLQKHINHLHKGVYACDECYYTAKNDSLLSHHVTAEHENAMLFCDQCSYTTSYTQHLKTHIEFEHLGIRYPCNECNVEFATAHMIKLHNAAKHHLILCDQCSFSTKSSIQFKYHVQSKHEGMVFNCDKCDVPPFTSARSLKIHRKVLVEGKLYPCDQCEKVYCLESNLQTHRREIHIKPKRGVHCDECDSVFSDFMNGLLQHKTRVHNTYKCERCRYTADNLDVLEAHTRTHAPKGKRVRPPNPCPHCDYMKAGCPADLRAHIRYQHEKAAPEFKCDHCDSAFNKRSAKSSHMRKAAKRDGKKHPCDVCEKVFCLKGWLIFHKAKEHFSGVKPYACDFCEKGFLSKQQCQNHMIQKHKEYDNLVKTT